MRGAAQGLRFWEKFAYAGVCPGFTEKLRMGAAAAALPNTNTSSIPFALCNTNTSSVFDPEHQFAEHLFYKRGSAVVSTRVLLCHPKVI